MCGMLLFIFTIASVRAGCCAAHCFLQNRCRRLNTKSTRTPAANVPVQTAVVHSTFTYIRVHAQSPPVHTHTHAIVHKNNKNAWARVCVCSAAKMGGENESGLLACLAVHKSRRCVPRPARRKGTRVQQQLSDQLLRLSQQPARRGRAHDVQGAQNGHEGW